VGDTKFEFTENFRVNLSNAVNASIGDSQGIGFILNDDTVNNRPVADAGPDQSVLVGELVTLDGSGSSDVDGDTIFFSWTFDAVPAGSTATLIDADRVDPTFTPDLAGDYVVQLIVDDSALSSLPDLVTITVNQAPPSMITLTPTTAQINTRDSLNLTVTLDQPALAGGQVISLGASNSIVTVPPTVTVPEDQTTVTFAAESGLDTGNVTVTASDTTLTSDSSTIQVRLREFALVSPLVGIERW
jgi:hypothetical protein